MRASDHDCISGSVWGDDGEAGKGKECKNENIEILYPWMKIMQCTVKMQLWFLLLFLYIVIVQSDLF
jgi:hypothetical protein